MDEKLLFFLEKSKERRASRSVRVKWSDSISWRDKVAGDGGIAGVPGELSDTTAQRGGGV